MKLSKELFGNIDARIEKILLGIKKIVDDFAAESDSEDINWESIYEEACEEYAYRSHLKRDTSFVNAVVDVLIDRYDYEGFSSLLYNLEVKE